MENIVCGSDSATGTENACLNEATPAVAPILTSEVLPDVGSIITNAAECDDAISSTTPDKFTEDEVPNEIASMTVESNLRTESDTDFFTAELCISDVPTEKITENVEDIVQDLENLLGEPLDTSKVTDSYSEVNSSNVEDIINVDHTNSESTTVPLSMDCDILPSIDVVSNESNENEINESILIEVAKAAEERNELSEVQEVEVPEETTRELDANQVQTIEVPNIINEFDSNQAEAITEFSSNQAVAVAEVITEFNSNEIQTVSDKVELVTDCEADSNQMQVVSDISEVIKELDSDNLPEAEVNISISEVESSDVGFDVNQLQMETIEQVDTSVQFQVEETSESVAVQDDYLTESNLETLQAIATIEEGSNNQQSLIEVIEHETNEEMEIGESKIQEPEQLVVDVEENVMKVQTDETVSEVLEDLLKDSNNANVDEIDSEEVCGGTDDILKQIVIEEQREDEEQENVMQKEENKTDVIEDTDNLITSVCTEQNVEQTNEELKDVSENIADCIDSSQKSSDSEETIQETQKQQEDANQEIIEQNLSTINTELAQPLTVEVEDPIFEEDSTVHIEQSIEKSVSNEELTVSDNLQITDSSSGSLDSVDNLQQQIREPLKMTITKNKSDTTHSILKIYDPNDAEVNQEQDIPKLVIKTIPTSTTGNEQSTSDEPAIPKITIKSVPAQPESQSSPRLTIKPIKSPNEAESVCDSQPKSSPKITIKPVLKPESLSPLKLTIRPYPRLEEMQCSPKLNIKPILRSPEEMLPDSHHSPKITIKPIMRSPEELEERHSPRITIKPIIKPQEDEMQPGEKYSSRITIKAIKSEDEERHSPRITIKPVLKPLEECFKEEERHSPRITIKPVVRTPDEPMKDEVSSCSQHSPRITIKPVIKPSENLHLEEGNNPKITIKPIIKPSEESSREDVEESHSPRITIKPILKPPEIETESVHSPRITIKPIVKPQEEETTVTPSQPFKLNIKPVIKPAESSFSSKITIKPVTKPVDPEIESRSEPIELIDFEEQIKQERIVLKIAKGNKRMATSTENEKLKKIKLKLSKGRGLAHIVQTTPEAIKRTLSGDGPPDPLKHFKSDLPPDLSISMIPNTPSDLTITRIDNTTTEPVEDELSHTITPIPLVPPEHKKEAMPSGFNADDIPDPLAEIPVFEITLQSATSSKPTLPSALSTTAAPVGIPPAPTPRKRGRPRKVPLEVREEFKDPKDEETPPPVVEESTRPKRSCRGTSITATLGIKPRKPRAPSTRGRGRGRGSRGGILGRPAKVCDSE